VPIPVSCPGCNRKYQAPDAYAGKRMKCQACQATLVVPEPDYDLTMLDEPAPSKASRDAQEPLQGKALWKTIIDQSRHNFGPAPRTLSAEEQTYFRVSGSLMMWIGMDGLGRMYRHQDRLRDRGQVVWSHVIQANEVLFDPNDEGDDDWPALVLYSLDPTFDGTPEQLQQLASKLFRLRSERIADREGRKFMALIKDEMARPMHVPVPKSFGLGRDLYMSALSIHRKHLPERYLAQGLFPLLVNPAETTSVMLLPSRWWSEILIALWEAEDEEDDDNEEYDDEDEE
jgi:hypothetical protein